MDGTNGNTALLPIEAKLISSKFSARGEVSKFQDDAHRHVRLDSIMEQGRIEDVLRLVVPAKVPPLSGVLRFHSIIDVPAGNEDVVENMRLDGQFQVATARFASLDIRQKLRSLSRKGQGKPDVESAGSSISNLRGNFVADHGEIHFATLVFEPEGAEVNLTGTYGLIEQKLNLHGRLYLDAKLSQTTTGVKAFFLKALDPLFRSKQGGLAIPIKITGDRSNPSFGLDVAAKK